MIKWIIIGVSALAFVGIIVLWAILARKKGKKNAKKLDDNITKFKSENEALDKQAKIDADKKKEEDAFANITLTDDLESEFEDVFSSPPVESKDEAENEELKFSKKRRKFDLEDRIFEEKSMSRKTHKKNRDEEFEDFLNEHSYSRRVMDGDLLNEIKNLPPKVKAILLGNLFNKFED